MIYYENIETEKIIDAAESLAYRIARMEHPNWYMIPEEEIVSILKEEGIDCHIEE